MSKIKIDKLYKVFGDDPSQAIKLLGKGLSKDEIFEKTRQVVGLQNISFTVEEGEIFVVMGLSGSGKSTLVRCVNRLITADSGKIFVDQKDLLELTLPEILKLRQNKFGMVFQSFALFPHLTVLDNVAYGLKIQGMPKAERYQKAEQVLKTVELENWASCKPHQLSGGMQQRVGLARALAIDPDILLMDEPFGALDPLIRGEMQKELLSIQKRMQKTIIFITHDLDEALMLGDRIALMKDGKIEQIGTASDILFNPATDYVEKFVEGVDKSKTLTAEDIMQKAEQVISFSDLETGSVTDNWQNINYLYVLDRESKVTSIIKTKNIIDYAEENNITKYEAMIKLMSNDFVRVSPDTLIKDLFEHFKYKEEVIVVVNQNNQLLGTINSNDIFLAMAGGENNA